MATPTTLSNSLIWLDKASDLTPFVASATNLIDLFQKCVVIPIGKMINGNFVKNSHYYTYINEKSSAKCIGLFFSPVVGNIVLGAFVLTKKFQKPSSNEDSSSVSVDEEIPTPNRDTIGISTLPGENRVEGPMLNLKEHPSDHTTPTKSSSTRAEALELVEKNEENFKNLPLNLREDADIACAAFRHYHNTDMIFKEAPKLNKNKEFFLKALPGLKTGEYLHLKNCIDESLWNDEGFKRQIDEIFHQNDSTPTPQKPRSFSVPLVRTRKFLNRKALDSGSKALSHEVSSLLTPSNQKKGPEKLIRILSNSKGKTVDIKSALQGNGS